VLGELVPDLPVTEVPGAPGEQDAEVARLVMTQARQALDLSHAPLWRAALLRRDPRDHVLVFVVHHVVFDGWSLEVFTDDLARCYQPGTAGPPAAPDHDAVQYHDFVRWQRELVGGPRREELTAYWRRQLAGAPTLELPADRPRPPEMTYAGAEMHRTLAPESAAAVNALARAQGTTSYVVCLAAFFVLLHRYSGQDDLVVGTPAAGRDHPAVEDMVGFFVNMLVLRGDVSGDPAFGELADRVGAMVSEAVSYGELPFEMLVDALRPPRDPSRSPLFGVAFSAQNPQRLPALAGLDTEAGFVHPGVSRFDLSWSITTDAAGPLQVEVEYNTSLFDEATVAQMAGHYDQILAEVTADPGIRLSGIRMLTVAERAELITRWNGPVLPLPAHTVPEEFAARVREAPGAVALVTGGQEMSYAELDRRANQLAQLLRAAGAGPGERVALCLRRTADLIVAILAVLKAGAAYVPLDPSFPAARMEAILGDAKPVAVLSHAALAGVLPEGTQPWLLDEMGGQLAGQPDTAPPAGLVPADLAYVLYTSGTTGRPKGVLIEHHSIIAFVRAAQDLFELSPADRVLGYASANFDVSVGEYFNALLTGARLYLAQDEERLSIPRLQRLMETSAITLTDLPPTVMALLEPERFTAQRIVFVGGEAFPGELVNRWNPGRRFFNGYGPTECTVTMIVQECPGTWDASPPIGLPIANHVAHVLDERMEPVPYGVTGELIIGGAGLARGYLNAPELTAEKFVPDPFGTTPDGRLYRTGDLARRQRDGSIVFVGRIDGQVKIRGLRIELGDVEAALATHPAIGQLAVLPWADGQGERHLVAYTSPASGASPPSAAQLREHVSGLLPRYMVPSFYVVLDALPLTVSGKVDQRRLPVPALSDPAVPPEDEELTLTERILSEEVFSAVLTAGRPGRHGSFFDVGGNSLQAVQLMTRIQQRFGVELSLSEFFQSPTIAAVAVAIDRAQAAALDDDALLSLIEQMPDDEAERLLGHDGPA
jgi:amino acid adenylation domain-containing protein